MIQNKYTLIQIRKPNWKTSKSHFKSNLKNKLIYPKNKKQSGSPTCSVFNSAWSIITEYPLGIIPQLHQFQHLNTKIIILNKKSFKQSVHTVNWNLEYHRSLINKKPHKSNLKMNSINFSDKCRDLGIGKIENKLSNLAKRKCDSNSSQIH